MEPTNHSLHDLFRQLGLPGEDDAIETFIASHRPLPPGVTLPEASFWTPVQSQFLREAVNGDADWAETVDQLNVRLLS